MNVVVKVLKNGFENNLKPPAKIGDVGYDLVAKSAVLVGRYGSQDGEFPLELIKEKGYKHFDRIDYIEYDTGVSIEPESGFFSLGYPRSGLSKYNLLQCNSVGVIDTGYRGTIRIRFKYQFQNEDFHRDFGFGFNLNKVMQVGDKVDQLVFVQSYIASLEYVNELTNTDRGAGGFGSTGK